MDEKAGSDIINIHTVSENMENMPLLEVRVRAFCPFFNPNVDFLKATNAMKSGHHLSHDRASKGYRSNPDLTSQTSLHACQFTKANCNANLSVMSKQE